jgi:hypothetical protein
MPLLRVPLSLIVKLPLHNFNFLMQTQAQVDSLGIVSHILDAPAYKVLAEGKLLLVLF